MVGWPVNKTSNNRTSDKQQRSELQTNSKRRDSQTSLSVVLSLTSYLYFCYSWHFMHPTSCQAGLPNTLYSFARARVPQWSPGEHAGAQCGMLTWSSYLMHGLMWQVVGSTSIISPTAALVTKHVDRMIEKDHFEKPWKHHLCKWEMAQTSQQHSKVM